MLDAGPRTIDSPMQQAWSRLLTKRPARIGLAVVAAMTLLAIYAPFIASEVALVWIDDRGVTFPVIADLFNQWSYAKPHDLLFNVAALALPPLLIVGWALRRWLPFSRRLLAGIAVVVLLWLGCLVPVIPDAGQWRALWDHRPPSTRTLAAVKEMREAGAKPPMALFAPIPHRSDATYVGAALKAPGEVNAATGHRFWLGTDTAGHDIAAQMLFGARISLTIGLVATGLSLLIGTLIGAVSGYFGGWVDLLLQRIVEIMMCFPTFILILIVVAMLGRDIFVIMGVIGLTGWAGTARLVRGEFLAQAVRDYVLAAEAVGLPRWRIMFRHILPNALTPLLISATFGIAGAVGSESALSFIGLGDPTASTWGGLLEQGRENISYGWLIYTPGLAVFALITALNLVGNGLREALDPKAG